MNIIRSNHYHGIYFKAKIILFFHVHTFLLSPFLISLNRQQIEKDSTNLKIELKTTALALLTLIL